MGCVVMSAALFFLATVMVAVALALPVWYEQRWYEFNKEAYTRGNLWSVCFYHPDFPDVGYGSDGSSAGLNHTCGYTLDIFKGLDYHIKLQAMVGLVGCGLTISLFTIIFYFVFMHQKKRELEAGYTVSRIGVASGFLALLAGAALLAAFILFVVTVDEISGESRPMAVAPWLAVAGACVQCLIGLLTLAFLSLMGHEAKHPTTDVDVMMHSTIHTIQVVEEDQRQSKV